jgi:hypothetical protein
MSGSGEPTVVTVDQVKALVATDLSDSDLEDVIAREEAWLARRIGALTGERTMLCYIAAPDLDMPLYLTRPTDEVTVDDDEIELEPSQVRLLGNGTIVERADAHWTGPTVSVTFTPNDDLEVERVIIELVRIGVSTTPFESERIGEYSYSRGTGSAVRSAALLRDDLVKELTPLRGPRTMRLQSSLKAPRIGAIS